jgi:pseudaminic acid synthase
MSRLDECREQERTYVIAEMSGNHGGDLSKALSIVDAAAEAGADCLKIQTYTADTITIDCDKEHFIVEGGLWDGVNLHKLYEDAHTPWEWHEVIMDRCRANDIDFLSTPFDFSAVDFLESLGVESYKIASPEIIDTRLVRYVAEKGKTMFVSCGMATKQEISDAVDAIRGVGLEDFYLLQCCSQYPADYSNMNLSLLRDMGVRFSCNTGLSDHSFGSMGAIVAVALGAKVVEKHFCISRQDQSADSAFSMEAGEFSQMVKDVRAVESILGRPQYGPSEGEVRGLRNRRSLFAVKDIKKGDRLTPENVRSIRPGQGLLPKYYDDVMGKLAKTDIEYGTPLSWDMIEKGGER